MKFHGFFSSYDFALRKHRDIPSRLAYFENAPYKWQHCPKEELAPLRAALAIESCWYDAARPYFKVWPAIADSLEKVRLDVTLSELALESRLIAIRFCVGREPYVADRQCVIRSLLSLSYRTDAESLMALMMQWQCGDLVHTAGPMTWDGQDTCEIVIDYRTRSWDDNRLLLAKKAYRYAIAVHLLADDPSIVQPDVLTADRRRFDESTDPELRQRLIEKARKRGVVGWRIGEQYETIPHFRRPHPALYHVGKGRTEQRIVFRAGSIVHRQKLTEVPTGYLDDDGREVEA